MGNILGRWMKRIRIEAGFTQQEVGAWAHVTGEMVGRCERGQNQPNGALRETMAAIAEIALKEC